MHGSFSSHELPDLTDARVLYMSEQTQWESGLRINTWMGKKAAGSVNWEVRWR